MSGHEDLWNVTVTVAQSDVGRVEESLARALGGHAYVLNGPGDTVLAITTNALTDSAKTEAHRLWRVDILCADEPDVGALAQSIRELGNSGITVKPRVERVLHQDWVRASQSTYKPIRAGRFFVHPSHHTGAPTTGAVELIVDAGPAFGTGTHESTFGCLIALDDLAKRDRIECPLDLGAGTGILSMAMSRAWNCPVLGVDIDPRAVAFARSTAVINRLHRQIDFVVSNGCRHHKVFKGKPYDLVVANILADPLVWMARDIKRHLAPGGRVILSGLLQRQERRVLAPYRLNRMYLENRIRIRGWSTLVLRRPSKAIRRTLPHRVSRVAVPEISEVGFF